MKMPNNDDIKREIEDIFKNYEQQLDIVPFTVNVELKAA